MLSDAAFASALTSAYRANLLLPQLKPPVNAISQAEKDASARSADQQRADERAASVAANREREQRSALAVSLERGAAFQADLRANAVVAPPKPSPVTESRASVDRVNISNISDAVQKTLADASASSGEPKFASQLEQQVVVKDASKLYRPRDVVAEKPSLLSEVLSLPAAAPRVSASRSEGLLQQYQRNNVATASSSSGQSKVSVRG